MALKKPSAQLEANTKVINLLIDVLPNKILCRLEEYKIAHDLWTQLIELHKDSSRLEDRLREDQLKDQAEWESILPKIEGEIYGESYQEHKR